MDYLKIILTSTGAVIALFMITKAVGNRQMSELTMFDYINGITIGSIAAEMATSIEDNFLKPLTAMIIFGLITMLSGIFSYKSIRIRRFVTGKSILLYENGKFYQSNFRKAKIDINEFLMLCRINGYFDVAKLQSVFLEPNGKLSFLPVSTNKPVTPFELDVDVSQELPLYNIIIDGKILQKNLYAAGKNKTWLKKSLSSLGIGNIKDVFLATVDTNSNFKAYKYHPASTKKDLFQ